LHRFAIFIFLFPTLLFAQHPRQWEIPDWSESSAISEKGRGNPYELEESDWKESIEQGKIHTLEYPVRATGILVPYGPLERLFKEQRNMQDLYRSGVIPNPTHVKTLDDLFAWLGLHPYPERNVSPVYDFPYPRGKKPKVRMGVTLMKSDLGTGLTFSCAACHSSRLFDRVVFGMTNRFPRSNRFFTYGIRSAKAMPVKVYQKMTRATEGETQMYQMLRKAVFWIGTKIPALKGLDTSLAQVSLSLSRRKQDEVASKNWKNALLPRKNALSHFVSDSKPAVWWNLKYKNRWLSDGSIVSGNPIYTNILWNEIGRGADLAKIETWLNENEQTILDLTSAVFASEAPKYVDFFPISSIDRRKAKAGEVLFNEACAKCHGYYEEERVFYPSRTKIYDVGTDAGRRKGMVTFASRLNELRISKNHGIVVEPQEGYVAPPLVGIWARWPYLHNNSIPNLCVLLTDPKKRPETFYQGEAIDPKRDFDTECVGYPIGSKVPESWTKEAESLYDTSREGMSNEGHEAGTRLAPSDKMELIEYLKTL